jgi:hypothetical protein
MRTRYFAAAVGAAALALAAPLAAQAATHPQGIKATHGVVQVHRDGLVKPMSVSGVTLYDTDGTAGWYTQNFQSDYYRANATFTLNPDNTASLVVPFAGAGGVQLCRSSNGNMVQLGEVETTPGSHLYEVGFLMGTSHTGISGDLCDGATFLDFTGGGSGFTALADLPVGDQVQVGIQQSDTNPGACAPDALDSSHHSHTAVQFTAADIHDGVEVANYQSDWYCLPANVDFNEMGFGQTTNLSVLGGPVTDDLIDFSGVTTCQLAGYICGGLAREGTDTSVASSGNGEPPALLEPTELTPSVYSRTCAKNKKGHTVCVATGAGPSSASILGAVPIGL